MTNVLLVTIDSLRADHVGHYGYDRETTPTIDRLAADGLSFDAYANSHWTRASFPAIITSTYPLEYGGFEYLSESRTTVGSAMQGAGYSTAAFHSNLWLSRDYNYDRGFDRFYDSKSDPSLLSRLRTFVKLRLDEDGYVYRLLQWAYDTTEKQAGVDVGQTYRDAEEITDQAIEWLNGRDADEDVFLWVHYMDVHHPYVPHDDAAADLGLSLDVNEREAVKLRRKMLEEPDELTDDEFQTLVDLYDAEIRYTDAQIDRLCDAVDRTVGLEDTAVVVTGDHGEEFDDHGGFSHNPSFYDEVLHVPFVVAGPDDALPDADGMQDEDLELLDTAPTVCDLGDASLPGSYRGRSALAAAGSGEDTDLISETWQGDDYKLCRRADGWKFIWDRDADTRELYDLTADPGEYEEVRDEHPEVADRYEEALAEHLAEMQETNEDLPSVEMGTETEERLKDLGYLE